MSTVSGGCDRWGTTMQRRLRARAHRRVARGGGGASVVYGWEKKWRQMSDLLVAEFAAHVRLALFFPFLAHPKKKQESPNQSFAKISGTMPIRRARKENKQFHVKVSKLDTCQHLSNALASAIEELFLFCFFGEGEKYWFPNQPLLPPSPPPALRPRREKKVYLDRLWTVATTRTPVNVSRSCLYENDASSLLFTLAIIKIFINNNNGS